MSCLVQQTIQNVEREVWVPLLELLDGRTIQTPKNIVEKLLQVNCMLRYCCILYILKTKIISVSLSGSTFIILQPKSGIVSEEMCSALAVIFQRLYMYIYILHFQLTSCHFSVAFVTQKLLNSCRQTVTFHRKLQ